jgi:hypothetical protein
MHSSAIETCVCFIESYEISTEIIVNRCFHTCFSTKIVFFHAQNSSLAHSEGAVQSYFINIGY